MLPPTIPSILREFTCLMLTSTPCSSVFIVPTFHRCGTQDPGWLSNGVAKNALLVIGRSSMQTWMNLASKSMPLAPVLNGLLLGLWQTGQPMLIPKGQLLLSSSVPGRTEVFYFQNFLSFKEIQK